MEDNKLFHNRYFLERLLGRGNFSEVWLAKDTKTDIPVALKIYAPATGLDDQGLNVFAREFSLVVNANHKNLLKPLYYDSFERKPYLVLPFCKKGSILKDVGKFTEDQAWHLLRDVASGLAWLHGMNPPVIHQDIKPDNVMVAENGDFMITDFGVSTHLKSTLRKSMSSAFSSAGTIAYMAPERFGKDNTPIMANDIYSLGATTFEMLTGDTPFGDDGGLVQKKGAEIPDLKGDYSEQLKKVIAKCLKTNPWERPTAEQLEKYAETALHGGRIQFIDEKTFIQKYRYYVISIVILVIAGCCAAGYWLNENKKIENEAALQAKIAHLNDSIMEQISTSESFIRQQAAIGDKHEEGYELAYIKAYDELLNAISSADKLTEDTGKNKVVMLQSIRDSIEYKLYLAYSNFTGKSALFEDDDPEVAEEFKKRASNIGKRIDVKKYEIKNDADTNDDSRKDKIK